MNQKKIRVTKKFTFDMAHALYGHDGLCKNIHGHTYKLAVTLLGSVIDMPGASKDGMVIDFSDFKSMVQKQIVSLYDHALVLNGGSPHAKFQNLDVGFEKVVYFKGQPTCENLVFDFVEKIRPHLPANVQLHHLRLDETPTSYAEWFASDNQ